MTIADKTKEELIRELAELRQSIDAISEQYDKEISLLRLSQEISNKNEEIFRKAFITSPDELEVYADNHMFDSVIRNLISNAIKFTTIGGKVSVAADCNNDHYIEVKITDSGIGMTPELKSKLFLLSEKTNRNGTEGEPSTGLGLLLCKEFIEKHDGKIWVNSQVGKGSIFSFTLRQFENLKT